MTTSMTHNDFLIYNILFVLNMGGHGGLNILPQKKWNVYNWDNRIKVETDKRKAREK